MANALSDLIARALIQPKDAIMYTLCRELHEAFPKLTLLETEEAAFDVVRFAFEGQCKVTASDRIVNEFQSGYDGFEDATWQTPYNAWHAIEWEGENFEVVTIGEHAEHCRTERHFLMGKSWTSVDRFFRAVCKWNSEVRGEVLVFHGHWHKDKRLFEDISSTSLDNLVFPSAFKEALVHEFTSFFTSQQTYERYGIAWKRGILLLGPPGNGKTHAIKGLINRLQKPALYVKSFKHQYQTDHACISSAFQRARESAPCILVLEDLDSLLDDGNRAFFLNEMDGFAANTGILTVATTNHPERLDPAILERPSRFDRKYTFDLPDEPLRAAYLRLQNQNLEENVRLTDSEIVEISERTEDFSYAYLKELVLSGLMLWIEEPGGRRMADLMKGQVETLRGQMKTAPLETAQDDDPDDPFAGATAYMRRWRR